MIQIKYAVLVSVPSSPFKAVVHTGKEKDCIEYVDMHLHEDMKELTFTWEHKVVPAGDVPHLSMHYEEKHKKS